MDYKTMYHILVRACSDAIDILDGRQDSFYARHVLQTALLEAEEMYISGGDETEESDGEGPCP